MRGPTGSTNTQVEVCHSCYHPPAFAQRSAGPENNFAAVALQLECILKISSIDEHELSSTDELEIRIPSTHTPSSTSVLRRRFKSLQLCL